MTMAARTGAAPAGSAHARLLDAANELFYAEGVHTVGIDRVIEHAGVAKASLYNTFGSKDALVGAYLEGRQRRTAARTARAGAAAETPRDRVLAVYTAQQTIVADPNYRGCAFVNA